MQEFDFCPFGYYYPCSRCAYSIYENFEYCACEQEDKIEEEYREYMYDNEQLN